MARHISGGIEQASPAALQLRSAGSGLQGSPTRGAACAVTGSHAVCGEQRWSASGMGCLPVSTQQGRERAAANTLRSSGLAAACSRVQMSFRTTSTAIPSTRIRSRVCDRASAVRLMRLAGPASLLSLRGTQLPSKHHTHMGLGSVAVLPGVPHRRLKHMECSPASRKYSRVGPDLGAEDSTRVTPCLPGPSPSAPAYTLHNMQRAIPQSPRQVPSGLGIAARLHHRDKGDLPKLLAKVKYVSSRAKYL